MKLSAILDELSIAGDAETGGRVDDAREIRRDVVRRALADMRAAGWAVTGERVAAGAFDLRGAFLEQSVTPLFLGDQEPNGFTVVGVEEPGGAPLWIAPMSWTFPAVGVGMQINATGRACGTGVIRWLEIYDAGARPFMLVPMDEAIEPHAGDAVTLGEPQAPAAPPRALTEALYPWAVLGRPRAPP